ncbi:hypothetical protein CTheo_7458 [Ceratobasidium theobromae]|uniref:Uncharacterized protein n=1 Tax=Ceratobasidium theobromae TaxID=1582974 RepID=A0A5N5QCD8_9AGAM|nr:hypothetical protein CTheo_7458 [Ceratobasidium theobromae]
MPVILPTPIAQIFWPHEIYGEEIVLDTEDHRVPKPGTVRVRALDGFLFVKDGRLVYPTYDKCPDWWKGVEVYGYASALTGDFRHFIWAGHWDEDFDGKHYEVVCLDNVKSMYKESNQYWREGLEEILWLETGQSKSYALLEPAVEYARGDWSKVIESWTKLPEGQSQADPGFKVFNPKDGRPKWWNGTGNRAWYHLTKQSDSKQERKPLEKTSAGAKPNNMRQSVIKGNISDALGKQPLPSDAKPRTKRRAISGASTTISGKPKKMRRDRPSSCARAFIDNSSLGSRPSSPIEVSSDSDED